MSPIAKTLVRRGAPKPTQVFDTFWRFAAERQRIFFARLNEPRPPWTEDPVLREYKFTNAYRASDRVSQYLIRRVIYETKYEPKDVVFRVLLFKLFNRIETWQMLTSQVGDIRFKSYRFDSFDKWLSQSLEAGGKIY